MSGLGLLYEIWTRRLLGTGVTVKPAVRAPVACSSRACGGAA
jgi:hypothetical protein